MNSISILLYIAGVGSNLGILFQVFGVLGIIASIAIPVIGFLIFIVSEGTALSRPGKDGENSTIYNGPTFKVRWVVLSSILLFFAQMIPSQKYIMAIAASEIGGKVLSNDNVNEAEKVLSLWIKQQSKELEKDNH